MEKFKVKFDAWIIKLNPYEVTSNIFFFLAIVHFFNLFDLIAYIVLGVLWRYAGLKTDQCIAECDLAEKVDKETE